MEDQVSKRKGDPIIGERERGHVGFMEGFKGF